MQSQYVELSDLVGFSYKQESDKMDWNNNPQVRRTVEIWEPDVCFVFVFVG